MLLPQGLVILTDDHSLPDFAMRTPVTKLLALGLILLVLLSMLFSIRQVLEDRQSYRDAAVQRVVQGTAGPQSVIGPLLVQQCTQSWTERGADGSTSSMRKQLRSTLSPATLRINGAEVTVNQLQSGIFPVNTFTLKSRIEARFEANSLRPDAHLPKGGSMQCATPVLMLAVGDTRGIRHSTIQINGQTLEAAPGTTLSQAPQGIHTSLQPLVQGQDQLPEMQVHIDLELVGTSSLAIVPMGDDTQLQLASNWPHPGFGGAFLPATREVRDDGFVASWQVSHLATSAVADFHAGTPICHASTDLLPDSQTHATSAAEAATAVVDGVEIANDGPRKSCLDSFQVRFVNPVDPYTLADRASKYGLLFIVLTFVAVGVFEVLRQLRVHPVQYLLVGSALAVFFLLLTGLGEHYAFSLAYLVAATACVLLLGFYASHILHGWRRGVPFAIGIALLYGLLYLLLQLQDNALLAGSIALFVVLALVMVATRKVDWYALMTPGRKPQSDAAAAEPPPAPAD